MFDWYEPNGVLTCPVCDAPLGGWQGKDGPCLLLVWREGSAHPVEHRVDADAALDSASLRAFELPGEFELYTTCAGEHFVSMTASAHGGVWTACGPPVVQRPGAQGATHHRLALGADARTAPGASPRWSVGLAAWIIQDGNYGDFRVGDRAEFALEFSVAGDVSVVPDSEPAAAHVHGDQYDVVARVVHVTEHCWILDFGLLAYHDGPVPDGVAPGGTVHTRIGLGVDPFVYFEQLSRDPAFPDMVYTWDVRSIRREVAPYVPVGKNAWVRDQARHSTVDVPATDARNDDNGRGYYLLDCEPLPVPPKRSSVTAH